MCCSTVQRKRNYKSSMNCSTVNPHCFKMSESVPLASSPCTGTTVLKTTSPVRLSRETWLPFWRNSTKPARFSARTTRCPETLGSLGMLLGDFDGGPEGFCVRESFFGYTPGFQVKLDRFAKVCPRALDVLALRRYVELRATCDVPPVFFRDEGGETIVHTPIIANLSGANKICGF